MQHNIRTPNQHTFITHHNREDSRSILPTLSMKTIHFSTAAKSTTLNPINQQFMACEFFRDFKQCYDLGRYAHNLGAHPFTNRNDTLTLTAQHAHRDECMDQVESLLQTQGKDIIPHVHFLLCYSYFFHTVVQDS